MNDMQDHLSPNEIEAFVGSLAFVREYAIRVVSVAPGEVTIELPFDERFSGPPGQFPASMVGTAGDVAAVSSCLSLLPRGWALGDARFHHQDDRRRQGREIAGEGAGCCRPAAPIRSAPRISTSLRTAAKPCAGRCWRPRAISRSSRAKRRKTVTPAIRIRPPFPPRSSFAPPAAPSSARNAHRGSEIHPPPDAAN